ncbi:MAG: CBS domain-containing protein [Armatimonadota bacterium]|nr:MAG: CBS domain-containing protein [Armatimonadota bacterium]
MPVEARDLMTRDVITVTPETPVSEIAKLLSEHNISGVPVVDEDGKLRGIISEADLVVRAARPRFPRYIPFLEGVIFLENPAHYEQEIQKMLAVAAADIMTEKVVTAPPDASVEELATLMTERNVNRIVIIEAGRIAGVVTRGDIVRTLAESE